MSKDERRDRWNRRKSHKTGKTQKQGFVSGNKRYKRNKSVNAEIPPQDQTMGRASDAA